AAWADATGAAFLAGTGSNEPGCLLQHTVMHIIQRLAESDAAGIVVVDKDVWFEDLSGKLPPPLERLDRWGRHLTHQILFDGHPNIARVAHQEERSHLSH